MVDTHCHLDMCEEGALDRARDAGLTRIATIGMNNESWGKAATLAGANDDVYAIVGVHPRDHLDGFRRVRPQCSADDGQTAEFRRDISPLPAGQRSAPPQKLFRSQHKDEDIRRRVRRHHPPDAIGQHHVALGRVDKPGRSAVPGEEHQEQECDPSNWRSQRHLRPPTGNVQRDRL